MKSAGSSWVHGMTTFEIAGRLFQVDVASDDSEDGLRHECWDITVGVGQGLLFTLVERGASTVLVPEMVEIPVDVLLKTLNLSGLSADPQ